jgi:hypothetical protein
MLVSQPLHFCRAQHHIMRVRRSGTALFRPPMASWTVQTRRQDPVQEWSTSIISDMIGSSELRSLIVCTVSQASILSQSFEVREMVSAGADVATYQ